MKNTPLKIFLLLAAAVPLFTQLPYMCGAWRYSRLDMWDWGFMLAFPLLCGALYPWWRKRMAPGLTLWCLVLALPGAAGYALGMAGDVHAVAILGAMAFLWGMTGVVLGAECAILLLPAFGILGLSCTSTNYWIGVFSGGDGLTVKFFAALILAAVQLLLLLSRRLPDWRKLLFGAGLAAVAVLYFNPAMRNETFAPSGADIGRAIAGNFIGRETEPSENDRRFFGKSDIRRAYFADDTNHVVAILRVSDFEDVHKVHPAGHCLRTSGRDVASETLRPVQLPGGEIKVNEILVRNDDGGVMVMWAWYENKECSTGSFLNFRRRYSPGGNWRAWQLATTVGDAQKDVAEKTLYALLCALVPPPDGAPRP